MSCCKDNIRDGFLTSAEFSKKRNQESDVSNMVEIPEGTYTVGCDLNLGYGVDNEGPAIIVKTKAFLMDKTSVTNREFAQFVEDTQYITESERLGKSYVFHLLLNKDKPGEHVRDLAWWLDVDGANWKHPFGDERSYLELLDHPVVHITRNDALAFCVWADKRLPSEVEWEIAARANTSTVYPWGDELEIDGVHNCNVWQGNFPFENDALDGFVGTAPANSFYENQFGLVQMIGNVWELCSNHARVPLNTISKSSLEEQIEDHTQTNEEFYAAKGGSFLCHHTYCNRYRSGARNAIHHASASSNVGFRCVKDLP